MIIYVGENIMLVGDWRPVSFTVDIVSGAVYILL